MRPRSLRLVLPLLTLLASLAHATMSDSVREIGQRLSFLAHQADYYAEEALQPASNAKLLRVLRDFTSGCDHLYVTLDGIDPGYSLSGMIEVLDRRHAEIRRGIAALPAGPVPRELSIKWNRAAKAYAELKTAVLRSRDARAARFQSLHGAER